MSRVPTSHTNRPAIRAIGWTALALLAPGIAAGVPAPDHSGNARPTSEPAAARFAACATEGPHLSRERFLCYRAAANLANERHSLPRARPWPDLSAVQTADATSGIGSAVGTGVSSSGSATRQ